MKTQLFLISLVFGSLSGARAASIMYDVSIDSSELIGHFAGPFAINFQLNDGSGTGDANNTAVLSNFRFGTGSASGLPSLAGGTSGSLASTVTITDSAFFNAFTQTFIPGSSLMFHLSLTTNIDAGPTPDQFSMAILDGSGFEIPTQGLGSVGSDVLLLIDINSANPVVQRFAADPSRSPLAGGPAIHFAEPALTTSAIPEPATWTIMAVGIAALVLRRR
jgi:hypothetical protein